MLKSMTGHGESRRNGAEFELAIEVRSVNHRFLRIVTKISDEVAFLQSRLEAEVRKRIARGSVFITVRFNPTSSADYYDVDEEVLRMYFGRLTSLAKELDTGERIQLSDLILLPGVVKTNENESVNRETLEQEALSCLGEALDGLNGMREREGENLLKEFHSRRKFLAEFLDRVRKLAPAGIREYSKRLEERLNQALAKHQVTLAPEDLIKEVALLADRSDISEEIARLASHLDQLHESLESKDPVGRKLEFLLQEMFREANTMASKSIYPELNQALVECKTELDRLKEQVQNVE